MDNDSNAVSQRDYFNEKIDHDRARNRERFVGVAIIGGIIWLFIERHMADLNNEGARLKAAQDATVSADTYKANEGQRKSEQAVLNERLGKIEEASTKAVTREDLTRETKGDNRASIDTSTKVIAAVVGAGILLLGILNYTALHRTTDTPPAPTVTVTKTTP